MHTPQPTLELPGCENVGRMNELIFILTTRCTQRCRFCCEPPGDPDMTTANVLSWLEEIHSAHIPWVDFSGGEPLLHPDILTTCREARQMGLNTTLSTNGSTLATHMDSLFPHVRQWNMSLHGMADTHDHIVRRDGSWKAVVDGCKALSQLGATVHITYVVTKENIQDVPGALDTLQQSGVRKLCFNYVFRRGHGEEFLSDQCLSQEAAMRLVRGTVHTRVANDMTVYHNVNLPGQCALLRSNGDIWAVPMPNGQDFERVSHIEGVREFDL